MESKRKFSKPGFTGIEVAIVVAVLALLGGVWYVSSQNKAETTETDTDTQMTTETPATTIETKTTVTTTETKTEPKDETADWKNWSSRLRNRF